MYVCVREREREKERKRVQGILTEVEGSVQLTTLSWLVLLKTLIFLLIQRSSNEHVDARRSTVLSFLLQFVFLGVCGGRSKRLSYELYAS